MQKKLSAIFIFSSIFLFSHFFIFFAHKFKNEPRILTVEGDGEVIVDERGIRPLNNSVTIKERSFSSDGHLVVDVEKDGHVHDRIIQCEVYNEYPNNVVKAKNFVNKGNFQIGNNFSCNSFNSTSVVSNRGVTIQSIGSNVSVNDV